MENINKSTTIQHYEGLVTLSNNECIGVKIGEVDNKAVVTLTQDGKSPVILNFEKNVDKTNELNVNTDSKETNVETKNNSTKFVEFEIPIDFKSNEINRKIREYNNIMTEMTGRSSFILAHFEKEQFEFISHFMTQRKTTDDRLVYFSTDCIFMIVDYLTRTQPEGKMFCSQEVLKLNEHLRKVFYHYFLCNTTMVKYTAIIRDFFLDWKKFSSDPNVKKKSVSNFIEMFASNNNFYKSYIYLRCCDLGLYRIMSFVYHKDKTGHYSHYSWVDLTKNSGDIASSFIFKNSKCEQDDVNLIMSVISSFCSKEGSYCLHLTMREVVREILRREVNPTVTEDQVKDFILKIINCVQPKKNTFYTRTIIHDKNNGIKFIQTKEISLKMKQNGKDLMVFRNMFLCRL